MVGRKIKIVEDEEKMYETTRLLLSGSENDNKTKGRRMVRNIIVLSFAFMVFFTASSSISQLQSSINPDEGLGVYSRAVAYGAMLFSSLFLPTFLIERFSSKTTIIFAMLGYTLYMGVQFHPNFFTLISSGVIMGLCAAPLWSAKSTYITMVSHNYADLMNDKAELIMTRFFGIFSLLFQTSKIWGNILSSTILSSGQNHEQEKLLERNISVCGCNFCPIYAQHGGALVLPPKSQIRTLLTIYLSLAFAGVGIAVVFLDPLKEKSDKKDADKNRSLVQQIVATFHQMVKPLQILIIPLTIWSGLEQGFFVADYSQAFVTCSLGVENLGYIIICYGLCNAISSISLDPIVRRIGRLPVITLGAILNYSMIITMFKWNPNSNQHVWLFLIAGVWGIADAVWQTQLKGLYGTLFHGSEIPAFSNYTLFESLGFVTAFLQKICVGINSLALIDYPLHLLPYPLVVYILLTGIFQFVYCCLVGTFPFNSFLSGFISTVACFVLGVCLRLQVNPENKLLFAGISQERAFADFIFAHLLLHLVIMNFIG